MIRKPAADAFAVPLALAVAVLALSCVVPASRADVAPPAPPWESPLAQAAPHTGEIRDGTGTALTPEALIERLADADFVLLGERHDNPDHHRLQAWITERLAARRRPYAVAFEMIDAQQAPKLAAYFAASPSDAAGLGAALNWELSGWPAWHHYRPIAQTALAHGAPLLAANLPPVVVRAVAKNGLAALPAALADGLRLEPETDAAILAAHGAEIQAAHCGVLPERSLAPFALAQYARDAQMARVMAEQWRQSDGRTAVILIAGWGHGRSDRGVPFHLARLVPQARIASLAFVEATDRAMAAPELAALPYDVIWFTARVDDADSCAALKAVPR